MLYIVIRFDSSKTNVFAEFNNSIPWPAGVVVGAAVVVSVDCVSVVPK